MIFVSIDFQNACEHARDSNSNFFGSAQCLGYNLEHGKMSHELCYPSEKTIINQVLDNCIYYLKLMHLKLDKSHVYRLRRLWKQPHTNLFI